MHDHQDLLISVDVETAGPYPGRFSLLAIGACLVADPTITFYVELQPLTPDVDPHALAISGLSLETLLQEGLEPAGAMLRFAEWVQSVCPPGARPVFVGFNAPFDWMFVNEYFHRYLGYNPFGHNALDIKAFYAGRTGARWSETSLRHIVARYGGAPALSHNALADAVDQAALMRALLSEQPPAAIDPSRRVTEITDEPSTTDFRRGSTGHHHRIGPAPGRRTGRRRGAAVDGPDGGLAGAGRCRDRQ